MVPVVTHHLLGVAELAKRWGVSRARIHALRDEGKIPAGTRLKGGVIWDLAVIEEHERVTGREVKDPGPYYAEEA